MVYLNKIDSFNLGTASEFIVAGFLIELGYQVYLPFDRRGKTDLIFYKDNVLHKAQVKRAGWENNKTKKNNYLRAVCAAHKVFYSKEDVDVFIFIDDSYRMWIIPFSEVGHRKVVILDKRINGNTFDTKHKFNSEKWRVK